MIKALPGFEPGFWEEFSAINEGPTFKIPSDNTTTLQGPIGVQGWTIVVLMHARAAPPNPWANVSVRKG